MANKKQISDQLGGKTSVALNFHVPEEFKKRFKIAAVQIGITQTELLQRIFNEWENRQK
jgi:hypothetical protein